MIEPVTIIADMWAAYEARVIPQEAGPVQRQEMRRAFYCGAWATFCHMTEDVAALPEAEAICAMHELRMEGVAFAALVERGEA